MIEYEFTLTIGYCNAKHTDIFNVSSLGYSDKEWDELPEKEKNKILEGAWQDWANNYIEGFWTRK